MKLKTICWIVGVGGALVVGAMIAYAFPSESEQLNSIDSTISRSAIAGASESVTKTDGAAEYMANLAITRSRIDEKHPLALYTPKPGIDGRNALDEIYFNGLPATAQSVDAIKALLKRGQLSRDEKLPLIRMLEGLHNRDNSTGENSDIELELRALAADSDKQVAGRAAIGLSRLGYLPGTESVLKEAFGKGVLQQDDYYGELAHLIPTSPPDKQKEFLAEIKASSNKYASAILSSALNSGADVNAAPFLKTSEDMAALLRETEPQFPSAVGQFSLGVAVQYTEWMQASAAIENANTGRSVDDIIVAKLSEPGTDPRKVMGYLASPQAAPLLASATPDSPVQNLVTLAERNANQNPSNPNMTMVVQEIRGRMTNPPPPIPKPVFTPPTGPVMPPTLAPQAPQSMPQRGGVDAARGLHLRNVRRREGRLIDASFHAGSRRDLRQTKAFRS